MEKNIKPMKGWVLCKEENGNVSMVCPYLEPKTLKYTGISGYAELFYTKKQVEDIAAELNEEWENARFFTVKATLTPEVSK